MSQQNIDQDLAEIKAQLAESDGQIARVTEDLIGLLIDKGLILFTDLPVAVQGKLLQREQLREKLKTPVVSIISDNDTL